MKDYLAAISDWDDAYANAAHIPGADDFIASWEKQAAAFRADADCELDIAYANAERNHLDLFRPAGSLSGLFVFVHGGYWYRFDKTYWSHLAAGPLKAGYAVAMPSYTLCPDAKISRITSEVAAAIEKAAALVSQGEIILAGHSAGGHLVTRQVCTDTALSEKTLDRIKTVKTISGVHDLRPLLKTQLNATLGLTLPEAEAASPAILRPIENTRVECIVGADERPEFVRQNALLANAWHGLGAEVTLVEVPGKHHFDIIEFMENRMSPNA